MQIKRWYGKGLVQRRWRITANRNVPLFKEIVTNGSYATQLVRAINAQRYNEVERLIHQFVPGAAVGVGAGFESNLIFSNPTQGYGFGIFRPGYKLLTIQVRQVARIMLPIIKKLGNSEVFRAIVLRLIRQGRATELLGLLRFVTGSSRLESVIIDSSGFYIVVGLPGGVKFNAIFTVAA